MSERYDIFFLTLGIINTIIGIILFNKLKKKVRINHNIGLGLFVSGITFLGMTVAVWLYMM